MKSIKFALEGSFDKIRAKTKTATGRCIAVPRYVEDEVIKLMDSRDDIDGTFLLATVELVTPVRVKDITDEMAIKEGFQKKEDSINFFKGYYGLKDDNYVFFIEFKLIESRDMDELR